MILSRWPHSRPVKKGGECRPFLFIDGSVGESEETRPT